MDVTREKVLDTAFRVLTRRGHSRSELETKLLKKEYPMELVLSVLDECERLGFVNDIEFARQYCEELKFRKYGERKIQMYMMKKGLDRDLIESTIEEFDSVDEQLERATEALVKKLKSLAREKDPWKKREKAYRFLVSRGFSGAVVSKVIDETEF